jgi:pyruvate dehydrogenase E1 component alpha subunit
VPGDIEEWRRKDPIARFEAELVKEGLMDEKSKAAMMERLDRKIAAAVEFAEASPYPAPEEALDLVYA